MHTLKSSNPKDIASFLKQLYTPPPQSHKGQNGKLLVIGGSHLFHAASIWSAEIASHFVDMVHYASTEQNNEVMLALKKMFRNGLVVDRAYLKSYIDEDDAILIGPGLERTTETVEITKQVLTSHPNKKFVIDAGSLQMLDKMWLLDLKTAPILTPHQKEFETLFGISIAEHKLEEKIQIVKEKAKEYRCVILLKAMVDIISDGVEVYVIEGGNAGLTKGGTGDILAGLTTSFYTKNDAIQSGVIASYLLKRAADELYISHGSWYNNTDLINQIPMALASLLRVTHEG